MKVEKPGANLNSLKPYISNRSYEILVKARRHCEEITSKVKLLTAEYLDTNSFDKESVCFVAVGSIGRGEALDASDIDLIPVLASKESLGVYKSYDQSLRALINEKIGIKVSKGTDLTKCIDIGALTEKESIGGDDDDSSALTRRVLILTEGAQIGGAYDLTSIRNKILNAYAGQNRTRGRHVLSLCNDLARYYRTLCIEYKAKVDNEAKDWCTRNLKLRHSRKLWYFSSMVAVASLAGNHPTGNQEFLDGLVDMFDVPTYIRLYKAVGEQHGHLYGRVVDSFTLFLEFMSDQKNRVFAESCGWKTVVSQQFGPIIPAFLPFSVRRKTCSVLGTG